MFMLLFLSVQLKQTHGDVVVAGDTVKYQIVRSAFGLRGRHAALYSAGSPALNTDLGMQSYDLHAAEHLVPQTCEIQQFVMGEMRSIANILVGPPGVLVQQLGAKKPREAEDTL